MARMINAAPLSHIGRPITSIETGNVAFAGHLAWSIPEGERRGGSGQDQGALQFYWRCANRDCYHALLPQEYSVFLQALTQGVALVVNTIAELLASLGASIAGASVRALQLRIARADVVHKYVDDDH